MSGMGVVALGVVGAAGTVEVGARLLQLGVALRSLNRSARFAPGRRADAGVGEAFVSVHLPVHDEPPHLVTATLRALARSQDCDFEVIVVDNNTPDPAVWWPLETECEALGPRFRFVHVEGLKGAKAGALNLALRMADPRTTHIAVVDADYQVDADFLIDGVSSLQKAGADYAQFPQAYRGVSGGARGVEHELGDYFTSFEAGADRPGSMLPTGTLSLFTARALRAVGGWPTATITEDAEMGVRLQRCGFRGIWLSRERGRGLLPVDLRGLRVQRARWAAGNLQVLKDVYGRRWPGLAASHRMNLTVQLTAWLSLWLPLAVLLGLGCMSPSDSWLHQGALIAAAAILASTVLTAIRMALPSKLRVIGWRARVGAVATKLALTWTSATAWLPALAPQALAFKRTNKQEVAGGGRALGDVPFLSIGFALISTLYLARGQGLEAVACGLLASVWLCGRFVDQGLRSAARANLELQPVRS